MIAAQLLLAACASVPALEVESVRFAEPPVGLSERAVQIGRAASGLGWKVEEEAPGRLRLTQAGTDGPAATVAVTFDAARFSARYGDRRRQATPDENRRLGELRDAIVAQSGI